MLTLGTAEQSRWDSTSGFVLPAMVSRRNGVVSYVGSWSSTMGVVAVCDGAVELTDGGQDLVFRCVHACLFDGDDQFPSLG